MSVLPHLVLVVALMCPALGQILLDPLSRPCSEMGFVQAREQEAHPLPILPAGKMVRVQAEVPGGRDGMFQFFLCPGARGDQQDCLIRVPVKIGGGSGSEVFDLRLVPEEGPYSIPIQLPADLTCSACTLMWEVMTLECEEGEDTCFEERTTSCIDVTINSTDTSMVDPSLAY